MECPYCSKMLIRSNVAMSNSFACPHCHKWLRVRRNYGARLARIAAIYIALLIVTFWLQGRLSDTSPLKHISFRVDASAMLVVVAAIDEAIMWLLPRQIEPAGQSGLIV